MPLSPKSRRRWIVTFGLLVSAVLSACSDLTTGPSSETALADQPQIVITVCQYGGDYPDCDPPPSGGGDPCYFCDPNDPPPSGGGDYPDDPTGYEPPSSPPPNTGISEELYDSLTEAEKKLVWENPVEAFKIMPTIQEALQWSRIEQELGAEDGPQDAVRHAYWSARVTQVLNSAERAKVWLDAHESTSGGLSKAMDLYNNSVGRQIGTTYSTVLGAQQAVRDAWSDGDLMCIGVDCPQ